MDNQEPQQDENMSNGRVKKSLLSAIGLNSKKANDNLVDEPQNKTVVVGDREATLVGNTAEQKSIKLDVPAPENKVPEEILYQWQAPEFSYTHKPVGWYLAIAFFFVGLCVLALIFLGSNIQKIITITLLAVMAVATSVWANRKPKILDYTVTNYGLTVDKKNYSFDDFRAFYRYMDYSQPTIDMVPGKRYGTLVSMPLATPESDEIVETIAHMIPEIEHHEDIMDKIVRRLRF